MQPRRVLDQKLGRLAQLRVVAVIDDGRRRGKRAIVLRLGAAQRVLLALLVVRRRLFGKRFHAASPSAPIGLETFDHRPICADDGCQGLHAKRDVVLRRLRQASGVVHQKLRGGAVFGVVRLLEDLARRSDRQFDGRMRSPPLAVAGVPRRIEIDIRLHRAPVRIAAGFGVSPAPKPFATGKRDNAANGRQGRFQTPRTASPPRLVHACHSSVAPCPLHARNMHQASTIGNRRCRTDFDDFDSLPRPARRNQKRGEKGWHRRRRSRYTRKPREGSGWNSARAPFGATRAGHRPSSTEAQARTLDSLSTSPSQRRRRCLSFRA